MLGNQPRFCLLMVDDESAVLSALKRVFRKEPYDLQIASNGSDALVLLKQVKVHAALIDLKMPEMDGLTLLEEIHRHHRHVKTIILTGCGGVQEAVTAMKLGAVDFLEKPFESESLKSRVAQLHQIWKLETENRRLREQIECKFGFEPLIGNSLAMLNLKKMIVRVGPADAPILIQGETGTGKELIAQAIHRHSSRVNSNFVPVDCGAINESVIGSELFGHVKGAFTGAHSTTVGLIRTADGGTLFLDEIGELSLNMQVKLLRTIQEREVRPVGSSTSYPVDVRIVSATNRDLEEAVAEAEFREDLYYRLNVVVLRAPALRERPEDIPLLARYFIRSFASEYSPVKELSREALQCLTTYHWPGNVRELENVIRRAVAMGAGEKIQLEDLPASFSAPNSEMATGGILPSDSSLAAYEELAIRNALTRSDGNRKRAAAILKIGEATLYRKLAKYRLKQSQTQDNTIDSAD